MRVRVPVRSVRRRMRRFFPSSLLLSLGQDLSLADGSGLQHYLIATYLWQSHNIPFKRGKKPFAGGWRCEWEVVMSRFASAR